MNESLKVFIDSLDYSTISEDRIENLQMLIEPIQELVNQNERININCICTHNSRRSHLTQVWAKVASMHYRIRKVNTYSGGTEATAMYPVIVETLEKQGIKAIQLSESSNPIYALKYDDMAPPIICFSKKYSDVFNPQSGFIAIMTCGDADEKCPVIEGASKRIPLTYVDPKVSDGTDQQQNVYADRSIQIATEMFYVFSKIEK